MDLPTQISLTPAMGQALARCAMIGYEDADAGDLGLTEAQMDELGTLIDSLLPEGMRPEGVEPAAPPVDFEPAFRELHNGLKWMQGHPALNRYLGKDFASIANDLIDRAYPGLRAGGPLVEPS